MDVGHWTNCTIAIVCKLINALTKVESDLCYSSATPEMNAQMMLLWVAWQMQGEESGDISYTQGEGPTGLDTVSFKARLVNGTEQWCVIETIRAMWRTVIGWE